MEEYYSMEELLPVVEKLSRKYTSNESSSISYENARMLMEAVMYCIEELQNDGEYRLTTQSEKIDAMTAYQLGYNEVVSKVYKAKELYESILEDFQDFGCRNYGDTILKGFPQFFLRYDPKFKPQDHLLTLDYPTLMPINNLCGVDVIYQYLFNIKLEVDFLHAFETKNIEKLLERIVADYKNLYFDNISYVVLLTGLGCILTDKPVGVLEIQTNELTLIQSFFDKDKEEKAEQKIRMLITKLIEIGYNGNKKMEQYFLGMSKDYAVRIIQGIKNNSLGGVFNLTDMVF
jgi:hypothetical protein